MANLTRGGFQGPVYPVNKSAAWVQSVRAYASLRELPEPPELVVIAVPTREVEVVVDEALAAGAKALCVLTAGFGETSPEGRILEKRLAQRARAAGVPMLGPNCLGVQNPDPAVRLDATFSSTFAPDGPIAFASQSGALGLAALDTAKDMGVGFSGFASLGNKADLSGNDLLRHFEADARTKVILLYLESLGNPQRFREIASEVGRKKPVVILKSGRSEAGARAAGSHTGAMAGPDAAVTALCRQSGVLRVETIEQLFDVARVLAMQPLPRGRHVAVITNAGGPGILATDALEARGLSLPRLSARTQELLRPRLRAAASVVNPVDTLAEATPEEYAAALGAALDDPRIDSVLAMYVPPITQGAEPVARAIADVARGAHKPILACVLGTVGVPEGMKVLRDAQVPGFRFPEGAAHALAAIVEYAQWRGAPVETPEPQPPAPPAAVDALARARARLGPAGGWLEAGEMALFTDAWGIPRAAEMRVAAVVAEAVAAAEHLGYPVVLKGEIAGVVHKTEAGALALDLRDAAGVGRAVERLRRAGAKSIVVQKQIEGAQEWLAGMVRDPVYGPLVAVGAGGTRAELWRDVERRLAPLSAADVDALVTQPRVGRLLEGWRGQPPGDRAALQRIVRAIGGLACAHPGLVELEVNPVLVLAQGCGAFAVDVRARIGPMEVQR